MQSCNRASAIALAIALASAPPFLLACALVAPSWPWRWPQIPDEQSLLKCLEIWEMPDIPNIILLASVLREVCRDPFLQLQPHPLTHAYRGLLLQSSRMHHHHPASLAE